MADVTYIPDANSGQMNNLLPWMLAGNGGFGGFGGGWGTGIVGFILGALVGNNGFGGLFGGNNSGMNGAGYVANALNNDTGRELILQAVNGNHEALTNLSNILHTDVASVQSALNTISLGIQNVGSQVGMTGLQVINAIQAGNAEMANQLCKCCCDQRQLTVEQGYQNQLRTVEQTNTLSGAIAGGNQRIVDAIADLKTTTVQEFCAARPISCPSPVIRNCAENPSTSAHFFAVAAENPLFNTPLTACWLAPSLSPRSASVIAFDLQ